MSFIPKRDDKKLFEAILNAQSTKAEPKKWDEATPQPAPSNTIDQEILDSVKNRLSRS